MVDSNIDVIDDEQNEKLRELNLERLNMGRKLNHIYFLKRPIIKDIPTFRIKELTNDEGKADIPEYNVFLNYMSRIPTNHYSKSGKLADGTPYGYDKKEDTIFLKNKYGMKISPSYDCIEPNPFSVVEKDSYICKGDKNSGRNMFLLTRVEDPKEIYAMQKRLSEIPGEKYSLVRNAMECK